MLKVFTLLLYVACLIFAIVWFINLYMNHEPVLDLLTWACWVAILIGWVAVAFRRLSDSKQQQKEENTHKNLAILRDWQQYRFGILATFIVLSIPIVVLLAITISDELKYHPRYVALDPLFEAIGNFGWIFITTGYLIQSINELVEVKQELFKRAFKWLSSLTIIIGALMYMIYIVNLIEVT